MSVSGPVKRRLVRWAPVALLLAFEFYLSSRSQLPHVGFDFPASDKVAHAGYFFVTGLLAIRAARGEGWSRTRTAVGILVATLAWGLSDELHQSFVPNRTAEAADVAADITGAALALLAARRRI